MTLEEAIAAETKARKAWVRAREARERKSAAEAAAFQEFATAREKVAELMGGQRITAADDA